MRWLARLRCRLGLHPRDEIDIDRDEQGVLMQWCSVCQKTWVVPE